MFENMNSKRTLMMLTGILMLGSIWGLLECSLGGLKYDIFGIPVSMGAVMAGLFGIGIMSLSRKAFNFMGVSLAVAIVAGILRLFAPVGSCVICAGIAIISEGVIFELIVNRKFILKSLTGAKLDIPTLVYAGVVSGFLTFSIGFVLTQILTPFFTEGTFLPLAQVVDILPLIIGRSFYAAVLGGFAMPMVMLTELVHIDFRKNGIRNTYLAASTLVALLCWVSVIFVIY